MISYQDALSVLKKNAHAFPIQSVKAVDAQGVCARDIISPMMVPSFRNSAMDGFAVVREDLKHASADHPVRLPITRLIAAGDLLNSTYQKGTTAHIMTGAPVPDVYDAIVPIEEVDITADAVTFRKQPHSGSHIRSAGEDINQGEIALRKGSTITPENIMLLSAVGISQIDTYQIPSVYLVCTGKEITDDTSSTLAEDKIFNTNAPYLLRRLAEENMHGTYLGIVEDNPQEFEDKIRAVPSGSIIITTGAVSKGVLDFIPASLKKLGATPHFHRVNIRPGKPILFATFENGSVLFALPGNPISTAVGLRFFVLPFLKFAMGQDAEKPIVAQLTNSLTKQHKFRQFLKAKLTVNDKAQLCVTLQDGQESFKIKPMAHGNAWVVLEESIHDLEPGMLVPVVPYNGQKLTIG